MSKIYRNTIQKTNATSKEVVRTLIKKGIVTMKNKLSKILSIICSAHLMTLIFLGATAICTPLYKNGHFNFSAYIIFLYTIFSYVYILIQINDKKG